MKVRGKINYVPRAALAVAVQHFCATLLLQPLHRSAVVECSMATVSKRRMPPADLAVGALCAPLLLQLEHNERAGV